MSEIAPNPKLPAVDAEGVFTTVPAAGAYLYGAGRIKSYDLATTAPFRLSWGRSQTAGPDPGRAGEAASNDRRLSDNRGLGCAHTSTTRRPAPAHEKCRAALTRHTRLVLMNSNVSIRPAAR